MPSSHRSPADLHALLHEKLDALLAERESVGMSVIVFSVLKNKGHP